MLNLRHFEEKVKRDISQGLRLRRKELLGFRYSLFSVLYSEVIVGDNCSFWFPLKGASTLYF
jgi:hypothetical protein